MSIVLTALYMILGSLTAAHLLPSANDMVKAILKDVPAPTTGEILLAKEKFKYSMRTIIYFPILIGLIGAIFSYMPVVLFSIGVCIYNITSKMMKNIRFELIVLDVMTNLCKIAEKENNVQK